MGYIKTIGLSMLNSSDIAILEESIARLGFSKKHYRIVEFGSHGLEMKVTSPFLHKIMKVSKRIKYAKEGKKDA